jgi:pimeloyl-ACP methyl ester carboxylesterase
VHSYFTHGPTLAYRTYGHGPTPLLAFHGFGRTGQDFHVLEGPLGELCTVYAFDLHYHGNSPAEAIRAEKPFTPKELATFFAAFMDELGAEKVLLLGYSFGGRTVLNLLEQIPHRVERAFMVAPDGLKTRPWYRGLAASGIGRWMYKRFVEHPERIHGLIHLLKATRLMNERMHRFLVGQSDTRAKRQLVHDVWLSYRHIEPSLHQVAANARQHKVPVHLFFGEFDRVIPAKLGHKLRKHAPEIISLQLLPFGHVLVTTELGVAMREVIEG